jgi:hypothetical protein
MWTSIVSVLVFFTRLKRQMSSSFSLLSVTNFLQPLPRICCLPYLTWNRGSHASPKPHPHTPAWKVLSCIRWTDSLVP